MRSLSLNCRYPPSCWIFTRLFLGACAYIERSLSFPYNSTHEALPSWPNLTIIISQRLHHQISWDLGLGLQHVNFRQHNHLVCNTLPMKTHKCIIKTRCSNLSYRNSKKYFILICISLTGNMSFSLLFFKLWKYDSTFTGDLENTEQICI